MNEQQLEELILDKNLTAPRLTPEYIDSCIKEETYLLVPDTSLTFCVLTLKNGFMVTGNSACASPENFDEEVGKSIAKKNAREKIWELEGYLLKEKLFNQQK